MEKKKSDWSKFELLQDEDSNQLSIDPIENKPTNQVAVPAAKADADQVLQGEDPKGILAKYQEKRISRKASLTAMKATYDAQIEVLNHRLTQAVIVEKAKADVQAEEYLQQLDAEHLAVLSEMGLRNKETRERALLRLTQSTVDRIKEVQDMDWPESMIKETMTQILALKKRGVDEIMSELGMNHRES